jgi:hypothetical protein
MAPVANFSIEIDAPIETVWQAMVELRRYHEWNPFIVRVETDDTLVRVGTKILLDVRWGRGGGTRSPEVVSRLDGPSSDARGGQRAVLEYTYLGWPARLGLIRGTRVQTITQRPGAPTTYETHEHFHGLMANGVPLRKVQDGFERHSRALKMRAESAARAGRAAG